LRGVPQVWQCADEAASLRKLEQKRRKNWKGREEELERRETAERATLCPVLAKFRFSMAASRQRKGARPGLGFLDFLVRVVPFLSFQL